MSFNENENSEQPAPQPLMPLVDENTAVAVQQRCTAQIALADMWDKRKEREVQMENDHFHADYEILDAAVKAYGSTAEERDEKRNAIPALSDADLHNEVVKARNEFREYWAKTRAHAGYRLCPLCEEVIKRYKIPGKAARYRLNDQPTVDAYFRSIGLNYNTVRSWFYRERAILRTPECNVLTPLLDDQTPYARSWPDFEKIRQLVRKIVLIVSSHNIDLHSAATDFLLIIGRRLVAEHDLPADLPADLFENIEGDTGA